MKPKYSDIDVQLSGEDGNAFAIVAVCRKQMKKAGCSQEEIDIFVEEALGGDYQELLSTCADYFNIY